VLASVPVLDYTLDIARVHARLAVKAMSLGKPRPAYDMIIAATAVAVPGLGGLDRLTR
jgi:tRNA(fMet)-specific endonuclease VapC